MFNRCFLLPDAAQLSLGMDMAFNRHRHATLQARRLLRDVARSPLAEKTTQSNFMLGALYRFQL